MINLHLRHGDYINKQKLLMLNKDGYRVKIDTVAYLSGIIIV